MFLQHRALVRAVALLVVLTAAGNAQAFFCLGKKNNHERMNPVLYSILMQRYAYAPQQSPVPPPRWNNYPAAPPPAYPWGVSRYRLPPR